MSPRTANPLGVDGGTIDLVRAAIEPLLDGRADVLSRIMVVLETNLCGSDAQRGIGLIEIVITQPIQRNFERREIFPQFRSELAVKVLPTKAAVFLVSSEQAKEILQDAQAQREKNDGPRGTAAAFTSLIRALEGSIRAEQFRGRVEFPGAEQVDAQRREASAVLSVGARVKIWNDDESSGKEATITQSHGPSFVRDPDGLYVKNGQIGDYRYGYVARHDDSAEFFYPAWQLAPVGESYGHLRLVK